MQPEVTDPPNQRYPGPDALYEYNLFAVICHEGQIDNGHYTNFARFQDEVGVSPSAFFRWSYLV